MCFSLDNYEYFPGQYIGALSDYYNSTSNSRVISSISCPQGANRHSHCNITFSNSGCSSYGNDAVISCIDSKYCNDILKLFMGLRVCTVCDKDLTEINIHICTVYAERAWLVVFITIQLCIEEVRHNYSFIFHLNFRSRGVIWVFR